MAERRTEDRRRAKSFRWVERRSGFDRRSTSALDARLQRLGGSIPLTGLVAAIFVALNMFDLLATRRLVDRGAFELNPVMRSLMASGSAWTAKLIVSVVVAGGFLVLRRYRVATLAMLSVVAVMGVLGLYHVVNLAV